MISRQSNFEYGKNNNPLKINYFNNIKNECIISNELKL